MDVAGVGFHVTQNVDTVPSEIMRFVLVNQSFGQELVINSIYQFIEDQTHFSTSQYAEMSLALNELI